MTCLDSCERLDRGLPWLKATSRNSKGCGANMRVTALGLLKFKQPDISDFQIGKWSQFQSAVTHAHPTALAASELTAITIIKIIEGVAIESLVSNLTTHCNHQKNVYHSELLQDVWNRPNTYDERTFIARGWQDCIDILERVATALENSDAETDPCDLTGEGWVAEEAFGTALLCFLLFPHDSREALIRAVNTKGDSDSIACITGAFVGAKNGLSSFPEDWVMRIEYRKELNSYIDFISG